MEVFSDLEYERLCELNTVCQERLEAVAA